MNSSSRPRHRLRPLLVGSVTCLLVAKCTTAFVRPSSLSIHGIPSLSRPTKRLPSRYIKESLSSPVKNLASSTLSSSSSSGVEPVVPNSSLSSNPPQQQQPEDNVEDDDTTLSSSSSSLAMPVVPTTTETSTTTTDVAVAVPSNPVPTLSIRPVLTTNQKAVLSASALIVMDVMCRRLFQRLAIAFPSSLGGCCSLLGIMLLTGRWGVKLYNTLSPGATLLAKWLPIFFVPSLITLPLAGSVGSPIEILKVLSVIVGGFFFTLLSTAGSVVGVTRLFGGRNNENQQDTTKPPIAEATTTVSSTLPPPRPKPFSDSTMQGLRVWTGATGAAALLLLTGAAAEGGAAGTIRALAAKPLAGIFLLLTTLSSFVYGARLPPKFTKVVHPLVTCSTLTWAVCAMFGFLTDQSFLAVLQSYRMGNGIQGLYQTGPGDILLFLLGPAVLSLAIGMYEKRNLIRTNANEVMAGVAVSSVGGLLGTALMVRMIQLTQPSLRVALLSRNITSPLAMAIATILGASPTTISLAVSIVVITGLLGASFGATILSMLKIYNPVARGMGIGAAAHGLGTAAFVNEKDAFPFAAISMALTATACTVLVSIPTFQRLVLRIALG